MGETITKIQVTALVGDGKVEFDAIVDIGATYTALPKNSLRKLGIQPVGEVTIELADGRTVTRSIANVLVELEGRCRANPIILGEEGDASVIGLLTLEACGLAVDPVNRKLVPIPKIHHY